MITTVIGAIVIALIGVGGTVKTVSHDGFGRVPTQIR